MSSARWQSLSGDGPQQVRPEVVRSDKAPTPAVPGGWQQPWQDEHGQFHYPYAHLQAPEAPEAPAEPAPRHEVVVDEQDLAPVPELRYELPVRIEVDPARQRLASVITFATLLVALWSIVSFTGTLSATLGELSGTNARIKKLLEEANAGLAQLDTKIGFLNGMADDTKQLRGSLTTIDADMGSMLGAVDTIATNMQAMDDSIGALDGELTDVDAINTTMVTKLGLIDAGLKSQLGKVSTMRRDLQATDGVLRSLGGRLDATNDRLSYVNGNVNTMGCRGIGAKLKVDIFAGPLRTGSAEVSATVSPVGAWGRRAGGAAC